jgi:uncharacterized cupredoxin-like copper-binding protein
MLAGRVEALRRAVAPLLLAATLLGACAGEPGRREISVRMRYSRFLPAAMEVRAGTTIDFVLVNADPIEHEFILGTEAEQKEHERGSIDDPHTAPGEATILGGETMRTTFTFTKPGTYIYGCHRPGHYAYGMKGTVRVT